MKKIRDFIDPIDARTAGELTRQIADFEDNADAETKEIRATYLPTLEVQDVATRADGVFMAVGESRGFDTTAGNLDVILQTPVADDQGRLAAVFKIVAANTLTVRPDGGALINGAASLAIAAVGLKLILSDGTNYWA